MNILTATFCNPTNDAVIVTTDEGNVMIALDPHPDNCEGWQAEYAAWVASGGITASFVPAPVDPIQLAESFIGRFFSTAQLLKMAMWVQQKTPTSCPKLFSTYQWEESITMLAISGSTAFPNPPFTFTEVATEVLTP